MFGKPKKVPASWKCGTCGGPLRWGIQFGNYGLHEHETVADCFEAAADKVFKDRLKDAEDIGSLVNKVEALHMRVQVLEKRKR